MTSVTEPALATLASPPGRSLKILLLGVFSFGSTDTWKLLALRRLGHRVVAHPYRDIAAEEIFQQGEPFDLVFVSKGVPLSVAQFDLLTKLGRARLLWWPDPYENWSDDLSAVVATGKWALAATSAVVLEKILRMIPARDFRTARILEGCDCEGPRPGWMSPTRKNALLHFGHLSDRRREVIETLRAAGIAVNHLTQPLYGPALQREVLAHEGVLGINSTPDLYSNRVQTVLAMGGTILQENAPGLDRDFEIAVSMEVRSPGVALFTWTAIDDDLLRALRGGPYLIGSGDPRSQESAQRVFDVFRWERVMERAIALAVEPKS